MGSDPKWAKEPYKIFLEEKWEKLRTYYKCDHNHEALLPFPLTVTLDTAIHMAVYSKKKSPLIDILETFDKRVSEDTADVYTTLADTIVKQQNAYGNTALHEAVSADNIEATKVLVEIYPELIEMTNKDGETPLFKAAALGRKEVVKMFACLDGQITTDGQLEKVHRQRHKSRDHVGEDLHVNDHNQRKARSNGEGERDVFYSQSILHVAIEGEHFGTALWLLEKDKSLGEMKDSRGMSALHYLANMPSAFKSGYSVGTFERLLYYSLSVDVETYNGNQVDDDQEQRHRDSVESQAENPIFSLNFGENIEEGHADLKAKHNQVFSEVKPKNSHFFGKGSLAVLKGLQVLFVWSLNLISTICFGGSPTMSRLRNEKQRHERALKLAKLLIKDDVSWNQVITVESSSLVTLESENDRKKQQQEEEEEGDKRHGKKKEDHHKMREIKEEKIPLLIATSRGLIEIVHEIFEQYPQAMECLNATGQNILHVAVMYRQRKIFDLIKGMRIQFNRMKWRIDNNGYTLLHQVSDPMPLVKGTKPGPAFQLQEELKWFEDVQQLIPHYYTMQCDRIHNMTSKELFEEKHKRKLEAAQEWIKGTSQSCSGVAVLVATIVFAAAYTVPGGFDSRGLPIFLRSPYFLFFTITDVVSLASSLTSVVMFLSILTSPFQYEDFHLSLPRKLTFGFTFLFLSVMTTMITFGTTILLTVRSQKEWSTSLISVAAFFPVTVFAAMQYRWYAACVHNMVEFFALSLKALPFIWIPRLLYKCVTKILKNKMD